MPEIEKWWLQVSWYCQVNRVKDEGQEIKVTFYHVRGLKLFLKSKQKGENKIQAVNTWAVEVLRRGAGIIK